jgi:hypothetical protein
VRGWVNLMEGGVIGKTVIDETVIDETAVH